VEVVCELVLLAHGDAGLGGTSQAAGEDGGED